MELFAIVVPFDILEYLVLGLYTGFKAFAMHGFDFEALVPAFHGGVIITVAFLANTLWA